MRTSTSARCSTRWASASGSTTSHTSGREQQRVAIARALATGNRILLADEPTGELELHHGVQRSSSCCADRRRGGKTVLVVTDNREISRIADRAIQLSSSAGRLERTESPPGGRAAIGDLHSARRTDAARTWFWLRWVARDLLVALQQVAAIALTIAIGVGMSAGIGSMTAGRQESDEKSHGYQPTVDDPRVQLPRELRSPRSVARCRPASTAWRRRKNDLIGADAGRRLARR